MQIEGQISRQSGCEIYAIVVDRFDYVTPWYNVVASSKCLRTDCVSLWHLVAFS